MSRVPAALPRHAVLTVLHDLVRSEFCRSRNQRHAAFRWPTTDGSRPFAAGGLELDSLEHMTVASDIMALFELYDSEIGDRLLMAETLEQAAEMVCDHAAFAGLTFRSSGSTGEPTESTHGLRDLREEAREMAGYFAPRRVVCLVPTHHIYGFIWGVLLPEARQVPVVYHQQAAAAIHGQLLPGDLVIAMPEWWRYAKRSGYPFPHGVAGVTSTAPLAAQTWQDLRACGLGELTEIYGSTETAGIGFRRHENAPFELLARWRRAPSDDTRLVLRATGGSVEAPDHLAFTGSRTFSVGARRDRQVQVGGCNVSPEHVARQLSALPDVVDCQVRKMVATEGDRLKAWVTTKAPLTAARQAGLRDWCRQNLSVPERPHLTFSTALAINEMGKAADWPIEVPAATVAESG